ncbi:MAG: hypothetical protein J0H17_08010 [Rhizobiales bacterium]|nr:hypothetical protein [Hyphomicrobiales bacterium]
MLAASSHGGRTIHPTPPAAPPPGKAVPQWLMMGPLHDMMQSVPEIAEETRRTNDLLREFKDLQGDILRELQTSRESLDLIRNESRLR